MNEALILHEVEAVEVVASVGTDQDMPKHVMLENPRYLSGLSLKIDSRNQSSEGKNSSTNGEISDVASSADDVKENKHVQLTVGCKCKKSTCLKKFCECVQNRSKCGLSCKCYNCSYQPDR